MWQNLWIHLISAENLFFQVEKLFSAKIRKMVECHFWANECWDSLASGHLGPLLLKSRGVWGWFYTKTFQVLYIYLLVDPKGQLISKWFLGSSISSKKMNEGIRLYYYDTSGRLVFVRFWRKIDNPKKSFWN
jgi:hypothetical protein